MKNIWSIFKSDIGKLHKNIIALIVVMGICVVPCLYAWFNIAANFDPYGKTNELKVGIVNEDLGYRGSLVDYDVNFGKEVMVYLSENPKLDWVLTDRKSGLSNLKKDKFYALIVIPRDFSEDMMSVFTESIKKPEIIYYVNEKKNAIAPKITDKAAQGILNYVNQLFSEKLYETVLKSVDNINKEFGKEQKEALSRGFLFNLEKFSGVLDEKIDDLKKVKEINNSVKSTIFNGNSLISDFAKKTENTLNEIRSINFETQDLNKFLKPMEDEFLSLKDENLKTLDFAHKLKEDLISGEDSVEIILDRFIDKVKKDRELLVLLKENIDLVLPENLEYKLDDLIFKMDEIISKYEGIKNYLSENWKITDKIESSVRGSLNFVDGNLQYIKVEASFKPDLSEVKNEFNLLFDDFSKDLKKLSNMEGKFNLIFDGINKSIDLSIKQLKDLKFKLDDFLTKLKGFDESDKFALIDSFLKKNPDEVSDFLKAPVQYHTNKVYPIKNYGSAMAPFYSTLAIWVGAIVMASMMKVKVDKEILDSLDNPRLFEIYFGRHMIFTLFGLIQSSLIILGDYFYLGIQCESLPKLLLAGLISSLVYVNIVYTLTVSFGDVGKAVSVVLMVMQVAGSGGTFPIQVTPKFFQKVYPMLPFVHSMNAMRETIGGVYMDVYKREILILLSFLIPSLILGLILRKPIIKLNEAFNEKLEDTKIM